MTHDDQNKTGNVYVVATWDLVLQINSTIE